MKIGSAILIVTPILATLSGCSDEPTKLRKACFESRVAAACLTLGDVLTRGDLVAKDPDGAQKAHDAACRMGSAEGCDRLADLLEGGTSTPEQSTRAVAARDQACTGGRAEACERLGHVLSYGLGVAKDPVRARVAYGQACKANRALACTRLQEHEHATPAPAPVADEPKPERRVQTVFTLHVVGKDANPDKERRCRERIAGLGARLARSAPITVTLSLATQNHLKVASKTRGAVFEESLPSSTVPELCREVVVRAARAFARESKPDGESVL